MAVNGDLIINGNVSSRADLPSFINGSVRVRGKQMAPRPCGAIPHGAINGDLVIHGDVTSKLPLCVNGSVHIYGRILDEPMTVTSCCVIL